MRSICALASCFIVITASAQDATQPAVDTQTGALEASPPPASPTPIPSIPDIPTLDRAFNQIDLGKDAEDLRNRIEMRKLQNEVARDPDVIAAKAAAEAAPTDLEKRERLRAYYDLNYGMMSRKASSPAVRAAIEQSRKEHLALVAQPRVRPETGEAPAPTPKKKKKGKKKHF
jgi:hypothetical protein